jgi:hypothetical protein
MSENSGRLAYDAYARAKGLDVRPWADLPDDDKTGWQLVAEEADRQATQAATAELLDTEASPTRSYDSEPDPGYADQLTGDEPEGVIGNH